MKLALKLSVIFFLLLTASCEDEIIERADSSQVIAVNSELYNLINKAADKDFENEITCIDFNYPFNLAVYNEQFEILYYQLIANDDEFVLVLQNLSEGINIALSYPITSVLDSGEVYEINNNEELAEAIKKCAIEDELQTCNQILIQQLCVWKITHLSGPNNEYSNAYFEVTERGNAGFYYNDDIFYGSWITYAIDYEPHLNINLVDNGEVGTDWNFDWKIIEYAEESITITNNIDTYLLSKECTPNCIKYIFEECEIEQGSETALFSLTEYIQCFLPFTNIIDETTVSVRFFQTEQDLDNEINEIISPYINTENPQVIYARIEDAVTGEFLTSLPILLVAEGCDG